MIIELYGLPGSGKTTFANQVTTSPEWIKVSLSDKKEIIWYFFLGSIAHPLFWVKGFIRCISQHVSLFYLWNFYCIRYAKYQKALSLSSKHTYVILDEGPLQNIISYPDSILDYKSIVQHAQSLPRADRVIVFDIEEEKRKTQLAGRVYQSWRAHAHSDKEWDLAMKHNDTTFKKFAKQDKSYYFYDGKIDYKEVKNVVTRQS